MGDLPSDWTEPELVALTELAYTDGIPGPLPPEPVVHFAGMRTELRSTERKGPFTGVLGNLGLNPLHGPVCLLTLLLQQRRL